MFLIFSSSPICLSIEWSVDGDTFAAVNGCCELWVPWLSGALVFSPPVNTTLSVHPLPPHCPLPPQGIAPMVGFSTTAVIEEMSGAHGRPATPVRCCSLPSPCLSANHVTERGPRTCTHTHAFGNRRAFCSFWLHVHVKVHLANLKAIRI